MTRFSYDPANRLLSETNPLGKVTSYEYDLAGNRRHKTDANGKRTEYSYDANRRLTKVLFADGTSYDFSYDARGNRTLEQSPSHRRELGYDAAGRLAQVVDGGVGRTITYGYDAVGNRTSMTLDTGEQVRYRWDTAGRLAEVIDPQGEVTRFRYDAAGRRSRTDYGNGTRATYAYDAVGQVLSIAYTDSAGGVLAAFGYGYDGAGNRTGKVFADGTREAYGYDELDRLVTADYPGGRHVEYGYDAVGNRTRLLDTGKGAATRWPVTATASSENVSFGKVTGVVGGSDAKYWMPDRKENGLQWLEVTYQKAERASAVRIHELNRAPSVMRVDLIEENGTSHTVYEGGDTTKAGSWLWVPFALTTYEVKKVRVWTSVTYQAGTATAEQIEAIGLDAVTTESYEYNGFNQLLSVSGPSGTTSFGYDGNGNQTSKTDAAGTTTYAYNYDNRLVDIAGPSGTSHFEYDANGLRTKKSDSTGTRSYLLDGLSVVAEYAPDASRLAWYTQSLARIDEVLSVVNSTGKYWYESDALGSTYALTSSAGAVVSRSAYDVFGERTLAAGAELGQPFGFTGREHDQGGLVYARARYMNSSVGRWTQPDPLTATMGVNGGMVAEPWAGVLAGGMPLPMPGASAYGYVGQAPAVASDPTGLAPVIYTGFGGQAIVTNGTYFSAGAVLGFFSKASGGPMYSSAIAFTYGLGIGLGNPVQVGIAAEFGIYWDLRPYDDACDYAGPFATAAADLVAVGIGLVWAVEPDKIRAIRDVDSLYAALDWPVGITFSAGISVVPGRAFSFVVSRSHLVQEFNCACRKP